MTERLFQSVPTFELQSYFEAGWAYVMPDFDNPNHSRIEWLSDKMPVYPPRSQKTQTENAHARAASRA
jgi:hypothetical protein